MNNGEWKMKKCGLTESRFYENSVLFLRETVIP